MKRIAMISYHLSAAENYRQQLLALFGKHILVDCLEPSNLVLAEKYDLVLVTSFELFEQCNGLLSMDTPLIKIQRTVSKHTLEQLNQLTLDRRYLLMDETDYMESEMFSVFRHLNLSIVMHCTTYHAEIQATDGMPLIFGHCTRKPAASPCVNVGHTLIDIMSIIDIGVKLKLDHILQDMDIRRAAGELQTANIGLVELMTNANRFEGLMRIMSQTGTEGVLGLDFEGRIMMMNQKAKQLLATPTRDEPKMLRDLFPDMDPFMPVQPFEDALIRGYEQEIIGTLSEIYSSGRVTGYVLRLSGFSNLEERQHILREKLLEKGHQAKYHFSDFYGTDDKILELLGTAKAMARTDGTVLIVGETGTGKELLAQAIHNHSERKQYSFVAVNCGAFPENLLESELFGYEEGAFTGAKKGGKLGLFELAHNGTLFLDEISEMPLILQQRLLRVIQEREIMRLGSDKVIKINVRIIAATNRNLRVQIKQQRFREDLFYRLNVLPLNVPPLRERTGDIEWIVRGFVKQYPEMMPVDTAVLSYLCRLPWKGNVRELMNVLDYHLHLRKYEITFDSLKPIVEEHIPILQEHDETIERALLKILEKAYIAKQRLGRTMLHRLMLEMGHSISEMQVRSALNQLAGARYIVIGSGRQGTVITAKGLTALRNGSIG